MSAPSVADMRLALGLGPDVPDAAVVEAYVASLGFGILVAPVPPAPIDPFAVAAAVLFRAPGSIAAIYVPTGGEPIPTRLIRGAPDDSSSLGAGSIIQETNIFQALRADVPEPQAGDTVIIDPDQYRVTGVPTLDVERVAWTFTAVPA